MLESRKDLVLALLYVPGRSGRVGEPIDGITRMEKLVFLAWEKPMLAQLVQAYDYKPDKFGPFSEKLQDDLEALRTMGLVQIEDASESAAADELLIARRGDVGATAQPRRYALTPLGMKIVERKMLVDAPAQKEALADLKKSFNSIPLDQLLSYVYNNSARIWTSRSVVADKYLR